MPTILTHVAVPLAFGIGLGNDVISKRLLIASAIGSTLPDIDVIAFQLGVFYGSEFAHRGFTHSLSFAAALALLGACAARALHSNFNRAFWFLFIAIASHGILDAFTDGGQGIAFLWPWSNERYFAPFQIIEVSPIGIGRFFSERGVTVLLSEILWVWLPCLFIAASLVLIRFIISASLKRN